MADVAGAIVGGTIGFFVSGGNPMGALYGAQIGMGVGSMVMGGQDQVAQGPKIGEVATQNSKEGVPRPIVFGVGRPIGGNIIASGKPIIKVVREKVSSGGKGGGGGGDTYQEREEVYRTYAIRICEGPVTGIRRVWRDNKLVYDALAGDAELMERIREKDSRTSSKGSSWESSQQENNAEFLKSARFYLGGYDQMPDPAMQSEFGVANVTAYRGTCYMVMDNEDLTPRRGSIPQYVFEVVRGEGFAFTSRPYPIEEENKVYLSASATGFDVVQTVFPPVLYGHEEGPMDLEASVSDITLRAILIKTTQFEQTMDLEASVTNIDVNQVLYKYAFNDEPMDLEASVTDIYIRQELIQYSFIDDPIDLEASVTAIIVETI